MLLALLLALTMDPAASDSAVTTATTSTTATTATTTTPTTTAEPVTADTPQGVGLVLPKVLPKEEPSRALRFVWRDHPSLRGGRNFRLDFGVKVQEDARDPGDDPIDFPTWELHRLRAGVDGEIFRQASVQRRARVFRKPEQRSDAEIDARASGRMSTRSTWRPIGCRFAAASSRSPTASIRRAVKPISISSIARSAATTSRQAAMSAARCTAGFSGAD